MRSMSWERMSHTSHDAMRSTSISPASTITSHSQSSGSCASPAAAQQLRSGNDSANAGSAGPSTFNREETQEVLAIFLPTIRFMDYRRMRRQFLGVRKPLPKRRVLVFSIFCLFLIGMRYFSGEVKDGKILIGLKFSTDLGQIGVAIALIIGIIVLLIAIARLQSAWSLYWAVNASYAFIVATIIYLVVRYAFLKKPIDQSITQGLFFAFGIVQVFVMSIVKATIYFGPRLALAGRWFSWTENYRLIEKSRKSITFCRYNDFSGLCGNNLCCLCLCFYRVTYRIIRNWIKGCQRRFGNSLRTREKLDPPFSHQIRYKGEVDENGKPHGFGEWLADNHYGERIEGYWWHGYPIAPFVSQEVGSGSIFVGSRVGYMSCKYKSKTMMLGVSTTELSISGHFFNDFPRTLFFSPQQPSSSSSSRHTHHLPIDLLLKKYDDKLSNQTIEWCFELLNLPVHNPYITITDDASLRIYLDRRTGSLGIKGYQFVGPSHLTHKITDISVAVKRGNDTHLSGKSSNRRKQRVTGANSNLDAAAQVSRAENIFKGSSQLANPLEDEKNTSTSPNDDTSSTGLAADVVITVPPTSSSELTPGKIERSGHSIIAFVERYTKQRHERVPSGIHRTMAEVFTQKIEEVWPKRDWDDQDESSPQKVAEIFADEDKWKHASNELYRATAKIIVDKWKPINSLAAGITPEEILIFIPGYNVTLAQGCAQLSHLVAFSKLPTYIYPFIFHWEGAIGGIFAPLLYPLAKKRAQDKRLGERFRDFMRILQAAGVRRLHLLSHSAGTRAFMNGMECCQGENLFHPIQDLNASLSSTEEDAKNGSELFRMSIQTIIMINPDYPVNSFLRSGFQGLHALCNHIAVYGDTRDQVLSFSETWNREKCLGKRIFDLNAPLHTLKPNTQYGEQTNLKSAELQMASKWRLPYACRQDSTASEREATMNILMHPETGFVLYPEIVLQKRASRSVWLDLDVIDTTFVETHTDFLKHCFYQVSREIMDDIREIIVSGLRAKERVARLDRRRGNVFCFRVAPANVRSLYR
ncbi:hypothetical protein IE077_002808 [Cardiosporidium cionae]|uniref:Uncharacterized protein n=1 Tax=Cardiosporidium cionae TaxID=476202 RepID=A0ABQ7J9X6_9APIC|nr:hypothetical protein IE077_002808 [Cardiosporidium cionae]|eukprot:KAF8820802.1 hypothetical protein IE077_002808 [Cardiosporidium cionae]